MMLFTYALKLGLNDDAKRLIDMDDDNNHYQHFFSFNGLKWVLDNRIEYRITQDEITKVERYWRKRLRL